MSPLFGSSDELAVKWNLPRVYELELIDEGEILCELEGADCDDPGAGLLVVTDQKVLFVSRPVLGEWTRIVSVPLADVESAEAFESHTWGRRRLGAFAISQRRKVGDWPTRHHDAASDAFAKFRRSVLRGRDAVRCRGRCFPRLAGRCSRGYRSPRRVFMGGLLWLRRCVVSVRYAEILGVQAVDRQQMSAVAVSTRDELWSNWQLEFRLISPRPRADEIAYLIGLQMERTASQRDANVETVDPPNTWQDRIEFEAIKSGRERAEQLVATIIRQKRIRASDFPAPTETVVPDAAGATDAETSQEEATPPISVGWGVARW